jgi:1-acyl-sn-glycerol-3-phosphate acyltransferase
MSQATIDPSRPHPRRWFYGLRFTDWLIYRLTWLAILPLCLGPIRLKGFGHRSIPQDGPMLLLPNHCTLIDPFMAGWLPFRPSRFMASAQPLKTPFLGKWLRALGAFPKKKFVKDRDSMAVLQELYEDGHQILIFPEGTRSWDGRQMPIGNGIGRLVKRLNSGVIISRMVSAYYFWPRWAHYPRFIPVHIEYEGPLRWPESTPVEVITTDIAERLGGPQRIPEGHWTFGWRMAHGLPDYLWACPKCFQLDGLAVSEADGNRVTCSSCRSTWKVELDTTLTPDTPDTPTFNVAEAYERLENHFGECPIANPDRFEAEKVVLDGAKGTLLQARKGTRGFDIAAEGPLVLDDRGLRIDGSDVRLDFADLRAISVEMGNKVQLRTETDLYRLVPEGGGVLRWGHFLHRWRCSVQGLPLTPLG